MVEEASSSTDLKTKMGIASDEGIHFVNVGKTYYHNSKHAVKNLTLTIEPNSIFTLLGHNGAGKTTTLGMMSGTIPITTGDIFISGESVKDNSMALKKIMGFCPQHNTLYDDLTVIEHLRLFATFKGKDDKE